LKQLEGGNPLGGQSNSNANTNDANPVRWTPQIMRGWVGTGTSSLEASANSLGSPAQLLKRQVTRLLGVQITMQDAPNQHNTVVEDTHCHCHTVCQTIAGWICCQSCPWWVSAGWTHRRDSVMWIVRSRDFDCESCGSLAEFQLQTQQKRRRLVEE
jgi:hypothetical protein